jgi:mono/diheme cytochrome c family protein/glucose/arabinose dehydrogenase
VAAVRLAPRVLALVLAVALVSASDDVRGQTQNKNKNQPMDVVHKFYTPPSPVLSPAEALKTFKLPPGFRIELVASEPLVHEPIAVSFDPDGRLWVCEMPAFMPDIDGRGERNPVCTVAVLEDSDGDGVMDRRTVFVDKLVMPRSIQWTSWGLLVCEGGTIWLCRDSTGGLHCDVKERIGSYTPGNVEHSLNGLMPALDNWHYNAKEGLRFRRFGDKWVFEPTVPRGQWGITQDDHGRLFYNVNDSLFRGDLVACYSPNAHVPNPLVNVALYDNQNVWPSRPTPGVNRGYMEGRLRENGAAVNIESACSPIIFRGDNLPPDAAGNVFICDPAVNLIIRDVFYEKDGKLSTKNVYDQADFLTSTDERFRPVALSNAPDGTLYIVDMYRGIVQHGAFMTSYLRKQTLDRALDKGTGLGRIYRVVHETTQPRKPPALGKLKNAELVEYLSHTNGWHRDMAQQLLVQRQDSSVAPALEKVTTASPNPLARLHALWTLEGLSKIDVDVVLPLLSDKDTHVRSSAVALSRNLVHTVTDPTLVQEIAKLGQDGDKDVRMQVVFTLGLVNNATADRALEPMLKEAASDPALLEAIVAGFAKRETEFLAARLAQPDWAKPEPWREKLLASLAGMMWRQRQPLAVLRFLHLIEARPEEQAWQQLVLLEGTQTQPTGRGTGIGGRIGRGNQPPRTITLPAAPGAIEKLQKSPNQRLATAATRLAGQLNWPGKDGKPLPTPPPLTPQHQALYELGRTEYLNLCAACHHPEGFGDAGKGPALIDSDWLKYSDERLVNMVLLGLRGPLTVNGEPFNRDGALSMPGMAKALDDKKIAAVLTYVRREWGDAVAPAVEQELVVRLRAGLRGREDQLTEAEVLTIK